MIVKTSVQHQWKISYGMPKIPAYEILDQAEVDGEPWYTVKCNREVADWVRKQTTEQWVTNNAWLYHENNFDIHYELYALMRLTWS
jgi:hypothetical protein